MRLQTPDGSVLEVLAGNGTVKFSCLESGKLGARAHWALEGSAAEMRALRDLLTKGIVYAEVIASMEKKSVEHKAEDSE